MFITVTKSKSGHRPHAEVQTYRVTWQEKAHSVRAVTQTHLWGSLSTIRRSDEAIPSFHTPGTISTWLHSPLFPLLLSAIYKVSITVVLKSVICTGSPSEFATRCHYGVVEEEVGLRPGKADIIPGPFFRFLPLSLPGALK